MLVKGEDKKYYVKGTDENESKELKLMEKLNNIIDYGGNNDGLYGEQLTALQEIYEDIIKQIDYYLDINDDYKKIIAIWVIGTYFHQRFEAYPYLFFNAMRGSGKTRILKLITKLTKGMLLTSLTEASIFRTKGTLGIDEFESIGQKDKQTLRELLNASYKKGLTIIRFRKEKERQVAEEMEAYRPIVMANIWGMDEVLGDRCIPLILEKSGDSTFTKLVENFDTFEINSIILRLFELKCSLCNVVYQKTSIELWNYYIKDKYNNIHHTTYIHNNTNNTNNITEEELNEFRLINNPDLLSFFNKIDEANIDGRSLELFMPLYLIGRNIGEEVFDDIVRISKTIVSDRKIDEITESKDILVYKFVSYQDKEEWTKINTLVSSFRSFIGEEDTDWINNKWFGRALKRLNLTKEKRRVSSGMEVVLNIMKAKKQIKMLYGERE